MRAPAFQFYPADHLADMKVRMLSWASRGLYLDLLCYCWREGWIPADSSAIAQLSGCHDLAIVEPCLALFDQHPQDPSKLIHGRLERERTKQEAHKNERSASGKKGAKARWGKGNTANDLPDGSANGSAIKEPLAKNGSSSTSTSTTTTSVLSKKPPTPNPSDLEAKPPGVLFKDESGSVDANSEPKPKTKKPDVELPHGEAFSAAWDEWTSHRSEKRSKLTPSTTKAQLKKLSALTESQAVAAIDASISNGWLGLFPETITTPMKNGKLDHRAIAESRRMDAGERTVIPDHF